MKRSALRFGLGPSIHHLGKTIYQRAQCCGPALWLVVALWGGVAPSAMAWRYKSQIAPLLQYYEYKEFSKGKLFIIIDGIMAGANYRGRFDFDNGLFIEPFDISLYGASALHYTSNGTGTSNNVSYFLAESRVTGGYNVRWGSDKFEKNHTITFYTGAAYRYTANLDSGKVTSTGAFSYDRINHMGYIPIGAGYSFEKNKWLIGVKGEYDIFLGGQQQSYFKLLYSDRQGDVYSSTSTNAVVNAQHGGYGMKFNIVAGYDGWFINPFFNYWSLAVSDPVFITVPNNCDNRGMNCNGTVTQVAEEPENTTIEVGARFGYTF